MVGKKIICPMRERIKEDKNELGVEITIQTLKYTLHLFHEENIK
jgi:hypothetical protein